MCLAHKKFYMVLVSNKMKSKIYHTVSIVLRSKAKYTTLSAQFWDPKQNIPHCRHSFEIQSKIYHTVSTVLRSKAKYTTQVSTVLRSKAKYTTLSAQFWDPKQNIPHCQHSSEIQSKIYHTVSTVLRSNWNIVETEKKLSLTRPSIHPFPSLMQTLPWKVAGLS
jgi:hypothetical protein